MTFLDENNVARVPATWRVFKEVSVWFEEALFGHRIWARQTPWLLFLEFLNVADAQAREGREMFTPAEPDVPQPYQLRYRMGLRNILYANGDLFDIAREGWDDEAKWTKWLADMSGADTAPAETYGYLRKNFKYFRDFADLVALVRQTTLEGSGNVRWSSRFIFPFGINALFTDAIIGRNGPGRDYGNFGRTGEILYYMVSRARRGGELRPYFENFFAPDQPKNKLAALLCAPSDDRCGQEMLGNSFLPYRQHPAFDRLVEDWLSVIALDLPAQDAFAYLAPLASLHVMLYHLETAASQAGAETRPSLVCEIIAPRRGLVRQRSIASFNTNDALVRQAVNGQAERLFASFETELAKDEVASEEERLDQVRGLLLDQSNFETDDPKARTLDGLRNAFEDAVETKLDNSAGRVHSAYGRYVGLVSKRGTNRYRYAPNDDFMKMLVVTRVKTQTEFSRFLDDLYAHAGLVFGPEEARAALAPADFDHASFAKNRDRLEARLASMGLLKRLSDGCAYVVNPLATKVAA
ncbi:hypothetical protein KOAAANKH_00703 [Brevundimonas sp. NIBR10]|uniref:hypothetical protein n=1 Tax=Brevundimonas sp. NIBR10 TaxID=3015997 RepID=UPI0022F18B37|nr:hypothetical protein [Brevundimonas sp. NIBR10]WGM45839.1 hypothetical protein KOAAANKH_00703 [Brevundimonas sp. NIBR10]